jgi:hypothetical protein
MVGSPTPASRGRVRVFCRDTRSGDLPAHSSPFSAITYLTRAWRRLPRSPWVAVQPHRCGGIEQIPGLDESDRGGEPEVGVRVVIGHPVTAAEREIVAGEMFPVEQCHDRDVVGPDIDRVVLGDRETDLEFARQIALAVERVRLLRDTRVFSPGGTLDPDLVIPAGATRNRSTAGGRRLRGGRGPRRGAAPKSSSRRGRLRRRRRASSAVRRSPRRSRA